MRHGQLLPVNQAKEIHYTEEELAWFSLILLEICKR